MSEVLFWADRSSINAVEFFCYIFLFSTLNSHRKKSKTVFNQEYMDGIGAVRRMRTRLSMARKCLHYVAQSRRHSESAALR